MTDNELVRKIRANDRALMDLLACPAPTADGASMGYDGEVRALGINGDDLLEEADSRGLDRRAALLGVIKRVEARPPYIQGDDDA